MRWALVLIPLAVACGDNDATPPPLPVTPPVYEEKVTPEFAGFGDSTPVEFSHFIAPRGCTFDAEAQNATCDVSGCTIPDQETWIEREEDLARYVTCMNGVSNSTGVDFSQKRALFVRQGTRVGEWMRREPILWVVDYQSRIIVAEQHRSFCITGSDINGGVVAYALLLPASTSSTAIERHAYRNPNGCDMCSGESDCSG